MHFASNGGNSQTGCAEQCWLSKNIDETGDK
jgi:hypothetical protein